MQNRRSHFRRYFGVPSFHSVSLRKIRSWIIGVHKVLNYISNFYSKNSTFHQPCSHRHSLGFYKASTPCLHKIRYLYNKSNILILQQIFFLKKKAAVIDTRLLIISPTILCDYEFGLESYCGWFHKASLINLLFCDSELKETLLGVKMNTESPIFC